jgi:hypothetical protein
MKLAPLFVSLFCTTITTHTMFTPNLAELGWCRKVTVTNSTPLPLTVKAVQTLAHVDRTQSGEIDVEAVVDLKPGQSVKNTVIHLLTTYSPSI